MYSSYSEDSIAHAILPTELLLLVKEFIADSDLRTHVCFYNTCRTTAAFYGDNSQQAEFWRRACVLSGIGWLKADSSWKEIAFETIVRDGFCTHPHCGGALLESNARMTASAMKRYNWDPENGAWDADHDVDTAWLGEDRPVPVCNPIFRYLSFGDEAIPTWFSDPRDIYVRNDDCSDPEERYTPLTHHAVALRSFAAFPAAVTMWFDFNDSTRGTPLNVLGVTVWEVMRCLHANLDFELSVTDLIRLLRGPFSDIFKRNGPSSNFLQDLQRFSTPRGLWSATRCDGLYFVSSGVDGPLFSAAFVARPEGDDVPEEMQGYAEEA